MRFLAFCSLFAAIVFSASSASAEFYFQDCQTRTGSSATLIVPESTLDASQVSVGMGSEFALFTPNGTCAGHAVWEGGSLAIAVWEDDPYTEQQEGFVSGESLRLALWERASDTAYESLPARLDPTFAPSPVFAPDAVYLVNALGDDAAAPGQEIAFALDPNFPNPFVDATTIRYAVGEPTEVRLDVYNMLGQHIAELVNEEKEPGSYQATFQAPANLSSGTYIYRIKTASFSEFHRMVLIR